MITQNLNITLIIGIVSLIIYFISFIVRKNNQKLGMILSYIALGLIAIAILIRFLK